MLGWWKRGRTSIQPVVPKTRACPGDGLWNDVCSVAKRPSSQDSSIAPSASTPVVSRDATAWTRSGVPSTICANDTG